MSENSYAPPSLTMGHLSIKLSNLFISIHHVRDKFPFCRYIIFSYFIFKTKDIYQIVKLNLQPNSTKKIIWLADYAWSHDKLSTNQHIKYIDCISLLEIGQAGNLLKRPCI